MSNWLSNEIASKTWQDWECPTCGGIERLSSLMNDSPMHRHKYGEGPLQSGFVLLRKVEPVKP